MNWAHSIAPYSGTCRHGGESTSTSPRLTRHAHVASACTGGPAMDVGGAVGPAIHRIICPLPR